MDDGFSTTSQELAVTAQAREPLPPPPLCLETGFSSVEVDCDRQEDQAGVGGPWDPESHHSGTATGYFGMSPMLNASSLSQKDAVLGSLWKRKARLKMELPPLPSLGDVDLTTSMNCSLAQQDCVHNGCSSYPLIPAHTLPKAHNPHSWPPSSPADTSPFSNPFGAVLPLTPPHELDPPKWNFPDSGVLPDRNNSLSSEADNSSLEISTGQQPASAGRPSTISLPGFVNMAEQSNSPSAGLDRAVETIISCSSTSSASSTQIQMVVQALPAQTKNRATKPVFQEVVERLQQRASQVPYITITHAVSQVVSMDEVPASPPATPSNQVTSDDYFDNQTVFTHAAVIPIYHGQPRPAVPASTRPTGIIAAPSSINVSTIERYIPPMTGQEIDDFFSISRRSYLVDRLTELSAANGTLLLIYPTQVGGEVFARQYIGPILDPFLRRFILLKNLTTDAAVALGKTAAVASLKTFEEMGEQLKILCRELTARAPRRGLQSEYQVIHDEKAEVTIDRMTWVEWFVEQETARIRQNMIDYQKSGGRMPAHGFDASPSSLAREVVEGIKSSREEAGGVGIEVGVFVIRRSVP